MAVFGIRSVLVVGLVLAMGSGCRSVQLSHRVVGATHISASTVPDAVERTPSRWPARWGGDERSRGTIIELDPTEPMRPVHLSRHHQFRSGDIEYADVNQLAADMGIASGFKFKPEAGGSFLFVPNPENKKSWDADPIQDPGTLDKANTPELAFKFVSATKLESNQPIVFEFDDPKTGKKMKGVMTPMDEQGEEVPRVSTDEDHVELQRTWFYYRGPIDKESRSEPVGTIVLLPGMFGTPHMIVSGLEKYWRNQGYGVIRMRSHPSRFTQHEMLAVKKGQESLVARKAARLNDDRVAEGAYATKAALEYVHGLRPELADKPVVLVGMSGGAMMLPTVYAYSPDSYHGAVLIAGGADFLSIAIESNYKKWIDALVFDFKAGTQEVRLNTDLGKPTKEQLATLSSVYLEHSKLDAYHTAKELGDIPVLMLHATLDQAVPASSGQLLYERLGEPDRWSYPLGHELIFAGLPTQVTRIDRWITKHIIEPAGD